MSDNRPADERLSLIDTLRYRPVATTAAQMREAADEIERLERELAEEVELGRALAKLLEEARKSPDETPAVVWHECQCWLPFDSKPGPHHSLNCPRHTENGSEGHK